jgi:beta-glucosidase-like glycosyl hydrolase
MTIRTPIDSLSLEEAVGQLICPTLFGANLLGQPYDEAGILADLERYKWGGYILHHGQAAPTKDRLATLQRASRVPLLIAADMEHGAGQQLDGLSVFPTAMAFGAAGDRHLVRDLGAWTAREALSVGVNWILAPVADVTNNPLNPIINIRSFGGRPEEVGELVAAFVEGCQGQGAIACAKHFPGHGDTSIDSHSRLAMVDADKARLDAIEFPPFRSAIRSDVASIMTAHLALPGVDPVERPATLSPLVMTEILRGELGFEGLIVTDALVMGGITKTIDPIEAAIQAIAAGCDVLLMPPDPRGTFDAVLAAVRSGRLSESLVRAAAARVLKAKERLETAAAAPERSAAQVAEQAAEQAVTLAKGATAPVLPRETLVLAVDDGVEPDRLITWAAAADRYGMTNLATVSPETSEAEWRQLAERAHQAGTVLLAVFSPIRIHKDRSLLADSLRQRLESLAKGQVTAVVSFSSPFLVGQFPGATWWVLAYGTRPVQIEAAARALFEHRRFPGRLPVAIPKQLNPVDAKDGPTSRGPSFA